MSSLKWHRRMKHEGLNQKGQRHNLHHFVEGARVYDIGHRAFLMWKRGRERQSSVTNRLDRRQSSRKLAAAPSKSLS